MDGKQVLFSIFLIACLFTFPQGQSFPRTMTNRFTKSTDEMNVNDITFTTSSPVHSRSPSLRPITYYNAIKHEYGNKGTFPTKTSQKISRPHTKTTYPDGLGSMTSVDQIYITEKPKTTSNVRYKPTRVYGVRDTHDERDGFSSAVHLSKGATPMHYQQTTNYYVKAPKTIPRRYAGKIVPFSPSSSGTPYAHTPNGAGSYYPKDKHGSTPSLTTSAISGEEISQISGGARTTFPGIRETETHTFHSDPIKYTDHPQSKKPYYSQGEKFEEEQEQQQHSSLATEDFLATTGSFRENEESTKESSQQNESVLSEVSTPHNGDKGENNLEEVADSVENMKTGERVEFQMYGMDGPKSYKFGFDTGKGQNRHFRFEERDKSGKVKGHYGYIDEEGKMRIMKYEADPLTGFRAGPVEITEDDNDNNN